MRLLQTSLILVSILLLSACSVLRQPDECCGEKKLCATGGCGDNRPCPQTCIERKPCQEICRACPELGCDYPDTMEGQLLCAATSIERHLNTLASAQVADSPPIIKTAPLVTPEGGMGCRANIDWTGPIAPLLDKIAKMTDYRLKILGTEPAIPIIVNITAKKGILAEILQNASYQAQKRAHVLVFPESHVIELRYLPA